jgi:Caspase domain
MNSIKHALRYWLTSTLTMTILGASLLTIPSAAQAPNDIRIALIIGNAAYPGNMALANPSNDAKDMASTLRNMGFGVIEVLDGNRAQMLDAIDRANKQLQGKQGVGMLFYAGHGLQLDWRNYMVPVDAKLNAAADVPKQTIDIEVVMKSFQQAGNRMNIVVLDACRDDPFANGKTSTGKGLAPLDAPTGTFLAYATAPGNVAQDGTGKNGLYTGFLLQELQKPTARIEDVFKRVRLQVRKASNGAQIPWEATSLEDDFVFNSGIKKTVKLTEAQVAKEFDTEKADWDKIKNSKNADDFYAYLSKYPSGLISEQASFALEQSAKAKIAAQLDKNGMVQNSNDKRFRVGDEYIYKVKNIRSGGTMKNFALKVEQIKDGFVVLQTADGKNIVTEDGAIVQSYAPNGVFNYDPPSVVQPGDGFQTGKKWVARTTQTFENKKTDRTDFGEVIAVEDVSVPAGTFKTYKVILTTEIQNGNKIKNTFWYQPSWGYPIKRQREIWNPAGSKTIDELYELESRARGAG